MKHASRIENSSERRRGNFVKCRTVGGPLFATPQSATDWEFLKVQRFQTLENSSQSFSNLKLQRPSHFPQTATCNASGISGNCNDWALQFEVQAWCTTAVYGEAG